MAFLELERWRWQRRAWLLSRSPDSVREDRAGWQSPVQVVEKHLIAMHIGLEARGCRKLTFVVIWSGGPHSWGTPWALSPSGGQTTKLDGKDVDDMKEVLCLIVLVAATSLAAACCTHLLALGMRHRVVRVTW